ncbi:hypothetical protein [Mucilaginibacter polytrichastri]|uniref:Uncharacterized protein n=1 Tax=Mucilaginibacter polytrichastri TaxID=1302689 RepID=A0A1Q5ZXR7_9SPHI|nr:hypothetical protein [Mucilaginibacter polytrichastri]OKS86541.1 hypothetical protein RG47T_1997 [Mucilaginibacter polytrichastri]SFS79757.1 hypothetical protein SAMN04487890_104113 [Mucilaginibacter polytrichastri]
MKTKNFTLQILIILVFVFSSCKKDNKLESKPQELSSLTSLESYNKQVAFSKILAKSLQSEPLLREKIKTEAKKQFDFDYDILFQAIKNDVLTDNESVYNKVVKYASSKDEFDKIINDLPLLTLYVPELPDFSADTWKANSEVPVVAIKPAAKHADVEIYDAKGEKSIIKYGFVPGGPTIVVKNNERLIVSGAGVESKNNVVTNAILKESNSNKTYSTVNGYQYSFISSEFDNSKSDQANKKSINEVINQNQMTGILDPISVSAYKANAEWQRDYIYYGLDPANGITSGQFRSNYYEYITGFSFVHGYDYENLNIGDDTNDPKLTKIYSGPQWTDGALEMRINIFMNGESPLQVLFSVKASDLFDVQYTAVGSGRPSYQYSGLNPKSYNPNIRLVPFNFQKYGTSWKFVVSEYDPAGEVTNTVTNTTTLSANFGVDFKIGIKFGISGTSTKTSTYSYKTTTGSDVLGEGILDFSEPIITQIQIGPLYSPGLSRPIRGTEGENYTTFNVTTGVVNLLVSPQKAF